MSLYKTQLGSYPSKMKPIIEAINEIVESPSATASCKKAFYDKLSLPAISEIIFEDIQQEVSRIMGTLWDIATFKNESFIEKVQRLQSELDHLDPEISITKVMLATRFILKQQLQELNEEEVPTDPIALTLFNPKTKNPSDIYNFALLAWKLFQEDPFDQHAGEFIVIATELLEDMDYDDPQCKALYRKIEQFSLQPEN